MTMHSIPGLSGSFHDSWVGSYAIVPMLKVVLKTALDVSHHQLTEKGLGALDTILCALGKFIADNQVACSEDYQHWECHLGMMALGEKKIHLQRLMTAS